MTAFACGLDRFINKPALRRPYRGARLGLLAHPASVTAVLHHALDVLAALPDLRLSALFGPQHGLKGDKQDNMVETADDSHPDLGIPVFSLYGKVRRPSRAMLDQVDAIIVDVQDLGCRIYTFLTTLGYLLEAAAEAGKRVCVLDRPNPLGRPVEGLCLRPGYESFVGLGALPMRHGLTLGELGHWWIAERGLDLDYRVITMTGWQPDSGPGYGWPQAERLWINPSPNAPNLNMARVYPGSVMIEGTTLSEGRGTTRPLEQWGAPDIDIDRIVATMHSLCASWLQGCRLRPCWFEPTFHKHVGRLCAGLHVHAEGDIYDPQLFRPWRVQALAFKAIRRCYPDYPLWRDFAYEYVFDRPAIDVINGSPYLRQWVDDREAGIADLATELERDEAAWLERRAEYLLY